MKTIIAGGRTLRDSSVVDKAVSACGWDVTYVVSGGQVSIDSDTGEKYGADYFGEQWANNNQIEYSVERAQWSKLSVSKLDRSEFH